MSLNIMSESVHPRMGRIRIRNTLHLPLMSPWSASWTGRTSHASLGAWSRDLDPLTLDPWPRARETTLREQAEEERRKLRAQLAKEAEDRTGQLQQRVDALSKQWVWDALNHTVTCCSRESINQCWPSRAMPSRLPRAESFDLFRTPRR